MSRIDRSRADHAAAKLLLAAALLALLPGGAWTGTAAAQTSPPTGSGAAPAGAGTEAGRAPAGRGRCHVDPAEDKGDFHPNLHDLRSPESVENCDADRIAGDRERQRIQRYLAQHVRPEDVVRSLELPSGEIVDCVDVQRQPALRRTGMEGHQIQFAPRSEAVEERPDPKGRYSEKEVDPGLRGEIVAARQVYGADGRICPERTIPIRRLTIEILRNFETLEQFFRKYPPHLVDGPNDLHQYAHAYRGVANWGAQSILNVWSPYTERASEFSLSQIWVSRGSGDSLETVEVGWQKYRDLYGDYQPRLFIYFTPDNYKSGGCYNLTCSGFVQVSNSIYIGGAFTNISAHPHPSPAWEFNIRWQKDGTSGHWWLKYGDTWVGYYPRSLFDGNGLRDQASEVDFGGEIIDEQPGGRHTKTDMGSGHFPADGFGYAAYQRQIRYITTGNAWATRPALTASRTDADCYDISVQSSSGAWERYFYFGGPGYWAHCQ